MRCRLSTQFLLAVMGAVAVSQSGYAQFDPYFVTADVYVKMNYWKPPGEQSAEVWQLDPNHGGQWTQLSNAPTSPTPPPRALFRVEDILDQSHMQTNFVWFLGVENIRIVRGSPGNFQDVSGLYPEYRRMVDHMVMKWESGTGNPQVPVQDPCGARVWPIATGNELAAYWPHPHPASQNLPVPQFFGMRFDRQDWLGSAAWRWMSPTGITEGEDVYVRFTLSFDLHETNSQYQYTACGVSWISAAGGCDYNFCVGSSQPSVVKIGTPYALRAKGVVLAVPHTLDHATDIQLHRRRDGQNESFVDRIPGNSVNEHAAHQCEPDGGAIPWHAHSPGENGHLNGRGSYTQWQGLEDWHDDATDQIFTVAAYNVPGHDGDAPINNVGLYMVFWWGHGGVGQ